MHDAGWRLPDDANFGRTLLALNIISHRSDITEYLLFTVGCNPNGYITSQDKPWKGDMTPLHMVCSRGTIEQLALLVWAGADVYARDSDGFVPIAYALHGSCHESRLICKYLEYCGVDRTRVRITAWLKMVLGTLRENVVQVRPAAVRFMGLLYVRLTTVLSSAIVNRHRSNPAGNCGLQRRGFRGWFRISRGVSVLISRPDAAALKTSTPSSGPSATSLPPW
jgi:hypothetical protein